MGPQKTWDSCFYNLMIFNPNMCWIFCLWHLVSESLSLISATRRERKVFLGKLKCSCNCKMPGNRYLREMPKCHKTHIKIESVGNTDFQAFIHLKNNPSPLYSPPKEPTCSSCWRSQRWCTGNNSLQSQDVDDGCLELAQNEDTLWKETKKRRLMHQYHRRAVVQHSDLAFMKNINSSSTLFLPSPHLLP